MIDDRSLIIPIDNDLDDDDFDDDDFDDDDETNELTGGSRRKMNPDLSSKINICLRQMQILSIAFPLLIVCSRVLKKMWSRVEIAYIPVS